MECRPRALDRVHVVHVRGRRAAVRGAPLVQRRATTLPLGALLVGCRAFAALGRAPVRRDRVVAFDRTRRRHRSKETAPSRTRAKKLSRATFAEKGFFPEELLEHWSTMEAAASPVAASTAPAMHKLMESMCNPEIFMVLGGAPPALQALGARLVSDPALIAKLTAVPSLQHLLSELLADPVLLESVVHNDEARTLTRAPRSRALTRAHAPRWVPSRAVGWHPPQLGRAARGGRRFLRGGRAALSQRHRETRVRVECIVRPGRGGCRG